MKLRIALLALTLIAAVQGQPPDTAAIIARMKDAALAIPTTCGISLAPRV